MEIKEFFDNNTKHIKIDATLAKYIHFFRVGWMQKNNDTVSFLGGKLLGVHPIRFTSSDDEALFVDILNMDLDKLEPEIHKLPGINKNFIIASNPRYLFLTYLIHRYMTSKLPAKVIDGAVDDLYLIMEYRMFSSLLTNYFKFNADVGVATMTYEKLSNKFLIKKVDNYQQVFEYRIDIVKKGGLHHERILRLTTDDATRIITDLQTRLRSMIKYIYVVMIDVIENGDKVHTTNMVQSNEEGEESVKDIIDSPDKYIRNLKKVMGSSNDLVNEELIYVIGNLIPNIQLDAMRETLVYMSETYLSNAKKIDEILDSIIMLSIRYLNNKAVVANFDKSLDNILIMLKGYWTSSKINDKDVINLKKQVSRLVKKGTGISTSWRITTITIGILLYLFLRGLITKNQH